MNEVKLGKVITLHRGYDLPEARREAGNVPVISSAGPTGFHNMAKLYGENVITGRYGTIGEVFYHNGECWPLNTTLYVSDFHGNCPRYTAYLLKAILGAASIDGKDKSTTPGVDRNVLHDLDVPFIEDVGEQKAVANLLGAIDDKIALSERLCAELEETAQLIYDYWFTQFDFPDESGRPYRSSGGKMIYNDSLKRCIPEGWRVERLGVLCDTRLGGTPDTSVAEYWGEGVPWLSSAEVANTPIVRAGKSVTDLGIQNSATSFAPSGSVLLSITRYIRPSLLAIDACFNQSVVAITETDELKAGFLYPFIKGCVPRYLVLRTGAQQPHINKETVDDTMLCVPPKEILDIYYSRVAPLYAKVIHAAREIDRLESLRGWLLPMLMNGQVKIGANGRDRDGVMSEDDAH